MDIVSIGQAVAQSKKAMVDLNGRRLDSIPIPATYEVAQTSLFDRKRTARPQMNVIAPLVSGHAWTTPATTGTR
ncbi:hypothetical protein [Gryllotalpicola koreensis]|uniref:Uncharacterized protein n=1 Tax=Gryllotalpicola koreensis TaxID=993086 RepID=A0ABP8A2Z1_9MICO